MRTKAMLKTHPFPSWDQSVIDCVEASFDSAQACTACADACLSEEEVVTLTRCIRLNLDCADICAATGKLLSRQTATNADLIESQVKACVDACRICGDECEKHASNMDHCRLCLDSCRTTERACLQLLEMCRSRAAGEAVAPEECV
jgi:hypothetical protein